MKLNLTFVPFSGEDVEHKIVCYGDKESLVKVVLCVQERNICTNVYLSEDKTDEQN